MMKRSILLLPVLLLTMAALCQQPTRSELEKQRAAIKRDIDELNASIKQTAKNRKATLSQLALVQKKLRLRMAAINNINKQINLIDGDIYQSNRDIYKLKKELDTLKLQYEKSVVYAYKNRSNYDFLNFLFSSTSFNDALKRIAYLRSYRNYREQQAATIRNTQELLKQKITGLNENKKKKGEALEEESKQRGVLEEEKSEKNAVIADLKSREKELNKELVAKKRFDNKLQNAIKAAIDREIRLARAREAEEVKKREAAKPKVVESNPTATGPAVAKKEAAPARKSVFEATPEGMIISDNFGKNKGRLPWPVESASVKTPFGIYGIEGTHLTNNNPGVTIETPAGASVKAVFDGEVSSVFEIEDVWVVLLRHGKYLTTYSGLAGANVSVGNKVKVGQAIGKAGESGEIDFILMEEKKNLDPELWLRKR